MSEENAPEATVFDKQYYDRHYRNPRTRATTPEQTRQLGDFIAYYLKYLNVEVTALVDIGCGLGHVLAALEGHYPGARCVGVEVSEYLCKHYGWTKASVTDFSSRNAFDLVVCNDVLQYLPDEAAQTALARLASLSEAALYLGVLTTEDWNDNCDKARTDGNAYLRSGDWYRRRLRRWFVNVGGGLFLKRPVQVAVWELERLRG